MSTEPERRAARDAEPMSPGSLGALAATVVGLGLLIVFAVLVNSTNGSGTFLSGLGAMFGALGLIVLGTLVVPFATALTFFIARGYGHRRRMRILMASVLADEGPS